MKRYDSDDEGVMRESAKGMWRLDSDLRAWALRHKATVEKIDLRPWQDCACSTCRKNISAHGDALREIEEIIGGN